MEKHTLLERYLKTKTEPFTVLQNCISVDTLFAPNGRRVPHSRAGALEIARLALVKDIFQFWWFNYSEERVQIRRVEVLLHNDLLQMVTWRRNK